MDRKARGALSPEKEVRQKIEKGDFGPSLQYNGADYALRNVINDKILLRRFSNEFNMKSYSQASFNEWMKLDKTKKKVQAFKEASLINAYGKNLFIEETRKVEIISYS